MSADKKYDCAVIGGGVAGLCLAIQLARLGRKIVVFEKHRYPFHKVCGEYVSNESAGFLLRLGLKLYDWELPPVHSLTVSTTEGYELSAPLGLGGFGISRFLLDAELVKLAKSEGVEVHDGTKVQAIEGEWVITGKGRFNSSLIAGAFGKSRPHFAKEKEPESPAENFVAVKYHVRVSHPPQKIALHNFSRGYCGISRVEDERHCLCYLTHASNLSRNGNNIQRMEEKVLMKNPHLKRIFEHSEFVLEKPVTVSNVRFDQRRTSDSTLVYLGDAAGCISPLTGNGMSMASYASLILCSLMEQHFRGNLTRPELVEAYSASWRTAFSSRIRRGQQLQYLFGSPLLSGIALRVLNPLEGFKKRLIASTHGVPF